MKKKKSILIKNILFTLIPACLTYLSKSDNILNYLQVNGYIGENINIPRVKDFCLILSIVLTFSLLTYNIIKAEAEKNYYLEQRNKLLGFNKSIFISALEKATGNKNISLDLRIFVPNKSLRAKIKNFFSKSKRIEFIIKNIPVLADVGITNNLNLEVYPNPQGLVGESYKTKKMVYDPDLKTTNETSYNLTEYQISKTKDLVFCLCCPIFNTKREVISIVAFDSKREIQISKENETVFMNSFATFTQSLYEYVPDIFKPKGGI